MSSENKKELHEQPLVFQAGIYGVMLAICLTIMALLLRVSWWAIGVCV